jgi:hypothetical protein
MFSEPKEKNKKKKSGDGPGRSGRTNEASSQILAVDG